METWVKIKQVEKAGYFVSDLGRVKVIKRKGPVIKIGYLRPDGYRSVSTAKAKYHLVHVLVMENFSVRPSWAECINHINGVKTDNRLVNLEWSTLKLNNLHAFKMGLNKRVGAKGEDHHLSRDLDEVMEIYRFKKAGFTVPEISRITGIGKFRIYNVYAGVTWTEYYKRFFPIDELPGQLHRNKFIGGQP